MAGMVGIEVPSRPVKRDQSQLQTRTGFHSSNARFVARSIVPRQQAHASIPRQPLSECRFSLPNSRARPVRSVVGLHLALFF